MNFEKEKKEFLAKKDKSKKGSIDKRIRKLVNKINFMGDFFTTSSCSGRILLIVKHSSGRKDKAEWLFLSHEKTSFKKMRESKALENLPKNEVWFLVEGAILHVACRSIERAKSFLNMARDSGFRRSGIISLGKNRVILEIISTEKIEAPVSKNKKQMIDEDYFKVLIREGNKKLMKTWEEIDRLHDKINVWFG